MKSIVITGATGGIGSELAIQYAKPGITLGLIARNEDSLKDLAKACEGNGAKVIVGAIDIRDRQTLHNWLYDFDLTHPIDLLIANAGVTCGLSENRSKELDHEAERLTQVNYQGVVNTVSGAVEQMRARRAGKIVLISSLAGLGALADMPSYSATKSAVIAYGHSLRRWLKPFKIQVTIICPGFVTTPMSQRHIGSKPFEIPASKAAAKMIRAINKKKSFYAFPLLLALGLYLCRLMPTFMSDWFMRPFQAEIEKDPRY